jgi:hypothetical protein
MAQMAIRQIDLALKTARNGGEARLAMDHEAALPNARQCFDQLNKCRTLQR